MQESRLAHAQEWAARETARQLMNVPGEAPTDQAALDAYVKQQVAPIEEEARRRLAEARADLEEDRRPSPRIPYHQPRSGAGSSGGTADRRPAPRRRSGTGAG